MTEEQQIPAGTVLIEQNSEPDGFYVLKRGSIGVYMGETLLEVFNAKDTVIGEMSVILNRPRTATVKARSNCTVVKYDANDLTGLFAEHPDVAHMVMFNLASRLDIANQRIADLTRQERAKIWQD